MNLDVFKKLKLNVYKHRSDIAFVTGMVGTGIGTFLFVKAAKKNEAVIEQYKTKKKEISENENLSDEEKKHETRSNTLEVIKGSAKNYALPTAVYAASQGLELYSKATDKNELARVNTLLTSSIATVELLKSHISKVEGENALRNALYGQTVNAYVNTTEDERTVEKDYILGSNNNIIDFSVEFTEEMCGAYGPWQSAKGANKTFLLILENAWQDKLHRGNSRYNTIFLRDVWESIFGDLSKFPKEWANAGWIAENPDGTLNYISFGIRPVEGVEQDEITKAFWNELPGATDVRLTFNCAYDVYELI